jgi:hypothetical protein
MSIEPQVLMFFIVMIAEACQALILSLPDADRYHYSSTRIAREPVQPLHYEACEG